MDGKYFKNLWADMHGVVRYAVLKYQPERTKASIYMYIPVRLSLLPRAGWKAS